MERLTARRLAKVSAYEWDRIGKSSQSDKYGPWIESVLKTQDVAKDLLWLNASSMWGLLSTRDECLPFHINGTTASAVAVPRSAGAPASGPDLIVEVKTEKALTEHSQSADCFISLLDAA